MCILLLYIIIVLNLNETKYYYFFFPSEHDFKASLSSFFEKIINLRFRKIIYAKLRYDVNQKYFGKTENNLLFCNFYY